MVMPRPPASHLRLANSSFGNRRFWDSEVLSALLRASADIGLVDKTVKDTT